MYIIGQNFQYVSALKYGFQCTGFYNLIGPQLLTDFVWKTSLTKFTHVVQEIRTIRADTVGRVIQSV